MAGLAKHGAGNAKLVPFARKRAVSIEPDLKKFLDECIVPALVREALENISGKTLEYSTAVVADCVHSTSQSAGAHQ